MSKSAAISTAKCEVRSFTSELRTTVADDGTKSVSGLIPYSSLSCDLGGFREKIAPGAFADALLPEADLLCLYEHSTQNLLGRTTSGTMTLMDSDAGLRYTTKLPNTTTAANLVESINRKDISGTSFGFVVEEDDWVVAGDEIIRTLLKVDMYEVSVVAMPAYLDSAAALRSAPVEIRTRLEQRDHPVPPIETRDASNCACPCEQCKAGSCGICSNEDCNDDSCDCDDDALDQERCRNYMEMTLALMRLGM